MTVYVLLRENQNHYGYVDTSVAGIFRDHAEALGCERAERARARAEGLRVEDEEHDDPDWQVSWKVEDYTVQ